jgi:misacylated tRNA(Ala) deacylase
MTDLLYYEDSYIKEFEAKIVETYQEENVVTLNRTAFFPGGGGQPSDTGWIVLDGQRLDVNKVKRVESNILHYVNNAAIIPNDAKVHGILDWDRRYEIMRTHTAMHILCGTIWRDYKVSVTGGNMDPGKGRMDFEFHTLTREMISEIEAKCNEEIQADRKIRTQIIPRDEALQIPDLIRTKVNLIPDTIKDIRTVEIIGLDLQADGGTHVNSASEVGRIKIVDYKSKGAMNKRLYLELE